MLTYLGPRRQSLLNGFPDADVVITTYETVRSDWADSNGSRPIHSGKWLRVVLDEGKEHGLCTIGSLSNLAAAHHIRNRSKQAFQSVCDLEARYRWCLTGTPVHNSLDDYGALLSFLRVHPFDTKSRFMSWIVKPMEQRYERGIQNLKALVRATCIRRIKQKALSSGTLTLPNRSERIQEVNLHPDDQILYNSVKRRAQIIAAKMDKEPRNDSTIKDKDNNVLVLLNSLRLICNHGQQLVPESWMRLMEKDPCSGQLSYDRECSACGGEIDGSSCITVDHDALCDNCATSEDGTSRVQLNLDVSYRSTQLVSQPGRFGGKRVAHKPSAKVLALLENLKREFSNSVFGCDRGKRCVSIYLLKER